MSLKVEESLVVFSKEFNMTRECVKVKVSAVTVTLL